MNTCLTADGACNVIVARGKKVLSHFFLPFQASLQSVLLIADAVGVSATDQVNAQRALLCENCF